MESTIILSEDLAEYDGGCRDKSMWVRHYGLVLPDGPLYAPVELRVALAELKSGAFVPMDSHEVRPRIAALKELLAEIAGLNKPLVAAHTVVVAAGPEQLDMFGKEAGNE